MSSVAIVLAGGASRRMGKNKLALPRRAGERTDAANSNSILQHVIEVGNAVADSVVVCVSPANVDLVPAMDAVKPLVDVDEHQGPLLALHRAWERTDVSGCDEIFVLAGDLPGLTTKVLSTCRRVLELRATAVNHGEYGAGVSHLDAAVVTRDDKLQPLLGCYRPSAGREWAASVHHGETRLMAAVAQLRLVTVHAASEGWPQWWTRPVHTPEDYDAWLREGMIEC